VSCSRKEYQGREIVKTEEQQTGFKKRGRTKGREGEREKEMRA